MSSLVPALSSEDVQSVLMLCDANGDGVVNYAEFVLWIASVKGAHMR